MDTLKQFQIIHLHYYELNTIDEIYEYFDGKVSKYDIEQTLNMDTDKQLHIMETHISLMTDQLQIAN